MLRIRRLSSIAAVILTALQGSWHPAPTQATTTSAPRAQAATNAVCMPFNKLVPAVPTFVVGDSFSENSITLKADAFQWSDGTNFTGGKATHVASNLAHGSLKLEMQLNNITLAADFSATPAQTLTLNYGEYGGNVNLMINGSLANTNDFGDLDGTSLGGVAIKVLPTTPEYGELHLSGVISQVSIGGQELFIDDVCINTAIPNPNDPPPAADAKSDLGDAPDSANHFSIPNTAYFFPASVPGRFPSTFDPATAPPAQGQGPLHILTDRFWLGPAVTGEKEADQMPDSDGVTNILALSSVITTPSDLADFDKADDGWLNRNAKFEACQPTVLQVQISRSNIPMSSTAVAYLNIWRDGNRDGDWQDTIDCPNAVGQVGLGFEWIGQNVPVNVGSIAPGGAISMFVTTTLVLNTQVTPTHWLRFTLSEERQTAPTSSPYPDGRGPTKGFKLGETEDYVAEAVPPQVEEPKTDLGDAPDSVQNHWPGSPLNTAYSAPATQGRFPTVWQSSAPGTDPSGPRHRNLQLRSWLGTGITWEREADIAADQDGVNNIKTGGSDSSNRDVADDGWLNPTANFPNCGITTLKVRVRRSGVALPPNTLNYLNVWFDGNRDGDWQDIGQCPGNPATGAFANSVEWIVPNYAVNIAAIPLNGFVDIAVPTKFILNTAPQREHWIRFTLSEGPMSTANGTIDISLVPPRADGRGPQFPSEWRQGETEDFVYKPHLEGEPGVLRIDKSLINPFGANTAGQVITYVVELDHVGGSLVAATTMTDPLPTQVIPVGLPIVTNPLPAAGPLVASLVGNNLSWAGWLNPGSKIRIEQAVRVRPCWGNGIRTVRNTAYAQQTVTGGGGIISDTVLFEEKCFGLPWDVVTYTLSLDPVAVVPGGMLSATLTFSNSSREDVALRMVCCSLNGLPPGVPVSRTAALAPEVSAADVCFPGDGELVKVPAGGSVSIVRSLMAPQYLESSNARIASGDEDGDGVVQVEARFRPAFFDIFVDALRVEDDELARACRRVVAIAPIIRTDLGDAPDSTNHFGAAMTAYPATPASYPTVGDLATGAPRGPIHHQPQHFHLGPRVSVERDADLFPDQDAPFKNLFPLADVKDRDRWDDGVALSQIVFNDCQQTKIPVQVFIDPLAKFYLTSTKSLGYVNLWLDSNVDGDWADVSQCPNTTGAVAVAPEHIVINFAVNPASLVIGLNNISVPTGLVRWPAANATKPVWMRVTLTTKPILLPLNAGATNFSDGRGEHYRLGETEDYLYRQAKKKDADVWIKKDGVVTHDGTTSEGAEVSWVLTVGNSGDDDASVQVRDEVPAGWNVARIRVIGPDLDPDTGFTADRKGWDGTIKGNSALRILLVTTRTLPLPTDPNNQGQTIGVTNTATVTATSATDSDLSNNTASATVRLSGRLVAPRLIGPGDGTICTGTFTVTGWAQPGVTVHVLVDGITNTTTTAAGNGLWQALVSGLSNGSHVVKAIASVGAQTSAPSAGMVIIVDTTLTYSPLSLMFTDAGGSSHRPLDVNGRTDDGGWQLRLKPNTTYTISVRMCCDDDPNASIEVRFGVSNTVTLSDPDNDGVWEGVFTTPGRSTTTMVIACTCHGIIRSSDGTVLIDPYGFVTDVNTSALLSSATVTALEAQGTAYNAWNAAAFNQINPQVTLADGYYSFFTPPGTYQIMVTRSGYQPHRSTDIVVTNQLVRYDVALTPVVSATVTHVVALTENGPEPAVLKVPPGNAVQFVNALAGNTTVRGTSSATSQARRAEANARFNSGVLAPGESFTVKFSDQGEVSYENGLDTGTIVVANTQVYLPLIRK